MDNYIKIIYDNVHKLLSETKSPNGKFRMIISESGSDELFSVTSIMINGEKEGKTVYDAFGINLGIKAYWENENTVVIKTKKDLTVLTKHSQVQLSNSTIEIEFNEE